MSSKICFNLDQSKILSSGNGLKCFVNLLLSSRTTATDDDMVVVDNLDEFS